MLELNLLSLAHMEQHTACAFRNSSLAPAAAPDQFCSSLQLGALLAGTSWQGQQSCLLKLLSDLPELGNVRMGQGPTYVKAAAL